MKIIYTLICLLGIGIVLWKYKPDDPPLEEVATQDKSRKSIVDLLSAASDKNIEQIVDGIEYGTEDNSDKPQKILIDIFPIWTQLKSQINKNEARAEIANKIRLKPGMLDLASSVLISKETARKSFGDNQALSRIVSIRILEEELKSGNDQPIVNTISKLNRKYADEYPDMGELQDVEDLLTVLFENSDYPSSLEYLISGFQISEHLKHTFIVANLRAFGSESPQYSEGMKILSQHFEA